MGVGSNLEAGTAPESEPLLASEFRWGVADGNTDAGLVAAVPSVAGSPTAAADTPSKRSSSSSPASPFVKSGTLAFTRGLWSLPNMGDMATGKSGALQAGSALWGKAGIE